MSKGRSAPTIEEIRAREEMRRASRKRHKQPPPPMVKEETLLDLTLTLPEGASKALAYEGLELSRMKELRPSLRYHEPRQAHCAAGRVTFLHLTMRESQEVRRILAPFGWIYQGKEATS